MALASREFLLNTYQAALDRRSAAFFIGAGLSVPAGFVNWKELLREIASDLDLSVDKEHDLIAVAQYHHNQKKTRAALNQALITEFTKDAKPTENHHLIAQLPVDTIWTTNYDHLIEDALERQYKRVDRKVDHDDLTTTRSRDVTVYKMHGDIDSPDKAVLTKENYERFYEDRRYFAMQLQGDLLSKTFLFLGYSFSDPNIDYILGRIRALVGQPKHDHLYIDRNVQKPKRSTGKSKADYDYAWRKLELRIEDLQRFGIQTHLIDQYSEITDILRALQARARRKNIFVSGAAADFAPLGKDSIEKLARELGTRIIEGGYNLVSGLGLGIGGTVVLGALQTVYERPNRRIDERTILRPFPPTADGKPPSAGFKTKYRTEVLSQAGCIVVLCGNKTEGGSTVESDGVRDEFEMAVKNGVCPIPIGATGSAALTIWKEVAADPKRFFGTHASAVAPALATLNKAGASEAELLKAVFGIIKIVSPK